MLETWKDVAHKAVNDHTPVSMTIEVSDDKRHWLTIDLTLRDRSGQPTDVTLTLPRSLALRSGYFERNRLQLCLSYWLPGCLAAHQLLKRDLRLRFSAGDRGDHGALCMDGETGEILIPDLYSVEASRKVKGEHAASKPFQGFWEEWQNRKTSLFWRGSTTGIKTSCPIQTMDEFMDNERVKACVMLRKASGFDVKISKLVQVSGQIEENAKQWLIQNRLLAEYVQEEDFGLYRYYLDLPGNGLAWGAIYKYLKGTLVFRPNSERRLLYHSFMLPWIHYVPIAKDLGDLEEKHRWANNNPETACLIAWRGRETALRFLRHLHEHFLEAALTRVELLSSR